MFPPGTDPAEIRRRLEASEQGKLEAPTMGRRDGASAMDRLREARPNGNGHQNGRRVVKAAPAPELRTDDGTDILTPVEDHELPEPYHENKRRFEDK